MYQYRIVALPELMSGYPIHRLKAYCAQPDLIDPSNLEHYACPFTTFPIINSHIHPRYVIYNTARLLQESVTVAKLSFALQREPILQQCVIGILDIYQKWTRLQPPDSFYSVSPPSILSDGSSENQTRTHRLDQERLKRRLKRNRVNQSPTPASNGKRQRQGDKNQDSNWLDCDTLRGLEPYATPSQKYLQKAELVRKWLDGIEIPDAHVIA